MQFRMIPFILSLAMFMEAVDSTIINTAIPVMAGSLQVDPIDLKIALISYLLSLAIFIPISGWLADKFGIKRIFIIGLYLFTISSFFCGMARNLPELVIARIFQGLGGSIMLPIGRLIIIRTYEKHELLVIMNQVIMVGALGLMLGPTLGGLITNYFSWRWIFYVNIPIGLINLILAKRWITEFKQDAVHRLDKVGFILFGFGLASLTFGLSAFSESTLPKSFALTFVLGAVILLFLYFLHSRKRLHPIVNTQLFAFRTFSVSALGNLFSRLSFGGIPFLIPLLLQICFGYSPQLSGFLLAPTALGVVLAKPISLRFLRLVGYKPFLIINTILLAILLGSLAWIVQETPLFVIALFTFAFGYLSAQQYTGMNSIAYSEISQTYFSSATSVISTLQQLAQSFGVAICAILLEFFASYFPEQATVTVRSLHYTFITMSIMTLFSVLVFLRLKSHDGMELLNKNI